jgi:hypothetical protein
LSSFELINSTQDLEGLEVVAPLMFNLCVKPGCKSHVRQVALMLKIRHNNLELRSLIVQLKVVPYVQSENIIIGLLLGRMDETKHWTI